MSTWQVTIKSTEIYCVGVEAETEDDAIEKAHDILSTKEGRDEHWHDSDGEIEINQE